MYLKCIDIVGLGLYHDAHWEIQPGLNVMIGESGSGKSMLYQLLHFGMGGSKINVSMLRHGHNHGYVRLCFRLEKATHLADITIAPGEVVIQRTLDKKGRSKALLNTHVISMSQLKMICEKSFFLSKQHAHLALSQSEYLLGILDRSIEKNCKDECKHAWHALQTHKTLLEEQQSHILSDQELFRLEEELKPLENLFNHLGDSSYDTIDQTARSLEQEAKRLSILQQCVSSLETSHIERTALSCYPIVPSEIQYTIDTLIEALHNFKMSLGSPEEELMHIHQKLALYDDQLTRIHALAKKFHTTPAGLHAIYQKKSHTLNKHHATVLLMSGHTTHTHILIEQYNHLADILSTHRKHQAETLCHTINALLPEIGIPHTRLHFLIEKKTPDVNGYDHVQLFMGTKDTEDLLPLKKRASGGEMSRLYLLINTLSSHEGCYLFDEVDTGISGQTAMMVGKYLYALARKGPVVVISHTPQVAAFADHLWRLSKNFSEGMAETSLNKLEPTQHDMGLCNMLEGGEQQESALMHAQSLIKHARIIMKDLA